MIDKVSVTYSNIPSYLKQLSNINIGGQASYLFVPQSVTDIVKIYSNLTKHNIKITAVGGASNLLFSEKINSGIVVDKNLPTFIDFDGNIAVASANVTTDAFVEEAAKNNFSSFEFLYGVPCHIGGTVCMNAGAYGFEMANFIEWVEVANENGIKRINKSDICFEYRKTSINGFITKVAFRLIPKASNLVFAEMKSKLADRQAKHPMNMPNLGSFFKNPVRTKNGSAGKLIESLGLKGYQIGGAAVSTKHANFIINKNGATATNILNLADFIKNKVKQEFNIDLNMEVRVVK